MPRVNTCCWNDCDARVGGRPTTLPEIKAWRKQIIKACGKHPNDYMDKPNLRLCCKHFPNKAGLWATVNGKRQLVCAPTDQHVTETKAHLKHTCSNPDAYRAKTRTRLGVSQRLHQPG
mmetsp:Transcript_41017/g.80471  ORF Transcript_41017/g.80471 Transcript_41017/m.80471 type:complete len:118 (+) Transcript_41017:119-472(+)